MLQVDVFDQGWMSANRGCEGQERRFFFFLADRGEWAEQRRTLEVEGWEEDNPGRACF